MVSSNYQAEWARLSVCIRQYQKKSRVYLLAKLGFFSLGGCFIYWTVDGFSYQTVVGAVWAFILYLVACVADNKCQKKMSVWREMQSVCKKELAYRKGDFSAFDSGECYSNPAHEYSFDLDIFGPSSLYNRINRCVTQLGRNRLAEKLTVLAQQEQQIHRYQDAIGELADQFHWRIKFMANRFVPDNSAVFSTFVAREIRHSSFLQSMVPYALVSMTAFTFLLGLTEVIAWSWFAGSVFINWGCSMCFLKKMAIMGANLEQLHKGMVDYEELLSDLHGASFNSPLLVSLQKDLFQGETSSLKAFRDLARILNLIDQRSNALIYLLFNGLFLYDIMLLRRILYWKEQHLDQMEQWLSDIAEFDALVSLANYAYNHPSRTVAEVLPADSDVVVEATEVYHPFLSDGQAVTNNFTLRKGNVAVVTGANMAGKSTFLRTIGLNYILACNGVPVCATSFKFMIVALFSSMRTTDNLSKDISYFHAELMRLKQLLLFVQTHPYTLIILDEILKGTNSKDKLEGSRMFLHEIIRYRVAALIATHDLELAKLEEEKGEVFQNYCFEIELSAQIKYTYRITKGVARNLNASFLLRNILSKIREGAIW